MNRSWLIHTATHKISNWKIGGGWILDIDNKWMEKQGLTVELIDEAMTEINYYCEVKYRNENL